MPPPPDTHGPPAVGDGSDWALIARIGTGDEQAFATLYQRYRGYLERFIYQTTRRPDLVEDIISEVMLAIWQQAARTAALSRASTWIMSIAHHQSLTALRRANRHGHASDDGAVPEVSDEGHAVGALEADNLLRVALSHLSAEQRAVLELVYFQGMHYRDIGAVLGCPENTVKTRVFSARQKLRDIWAQVSGEAPDTRRTARGSEHE